MKLIQVKLRAEQRADLASTWLAVHEKAGGVRNAVWDRVGARIAVSIWAGLYLWERTELQKSSKILNLLNRM